MKLTADEVLTFLAEVMPQASALGMQIESLDATGLRLRLPFRERFLRPGGTISGPTLMMAADTAAFVLVLAWVGREALAVTSNLNIHFLRKPAPADLILEARVLKGGRRLFVTEAMIYSDGDDALVAHATVTYAIPQAKEAAPGSSMSTEPQD